mmetsp:Transcript_124563/g.398784  ORF Transcript_124563/g.398784 Transcript_124563/m.398784 type:complete len:252 (+) Transcript_124563:105-860(+)
MPPALSEPHAYRLPVGAEVAWCVRTQDERPDSKAQVVDDEGAHCEGGKQRIIFMDAQHDEDNVLRASARVAWSIYSQPRPRRVHMRRGRGARLGPHGTPLLGGGGVDAHRPVEVRLRGPSPHRDAQALHHLPGVRGDHVDADDAPRLGETVGDREQLHQDVFLVASSCGHRVLQGLELRNVDIHAAVFDCGVGLREAAGADRRLTEHRAGHVVVVRPRLHAPEQGLRHRDALHEGHRRQIHPVCDIADSVD